MPTQPSAKSTAGETRGRELISHAHAHARARVVPGSGSAGDPSRRRRCRCTARGCPSAGVGRPAARRARWRPPLRARAPVQSIGRSRWGEIRLRHTVDVRFTRNTVPGLRQVWAHGPSWRGTGKRTKTIRGISTSTSAGASVLPPWPPCCGLPRAHQGRTTLHRCQSV